MWVKLSDDFFRHPKIVAAGRDARDLYLVGLSHCNEHLTDGFICARFLRRLAADAEIEDTTAAVAALETNLLWHPAPGGWRVHDFLDYNPARVQVEAEREKTAGRKQAWKGRRPSGQGNGVPDPVPAAVPNGVPAPDGTPAPVPVPEPDPINEIPDTNINSTEETRTLPLLSLEDVSADRPLSPGKLPGKPSTDRELAAWFETEFWPLYPRKVERQAAFCALRALRPDKELRETILLGLRRVLRSPSWEEAIERRDLRYLPHPDTWLRNRRWEDEVEMAPQALPPRSALPRRLSPHEEATRRNRDGNRRFVETLSQGMVDPVVAALLETGEPR